jgi:hypothetical protein
LFQIQKASFIEKEHFVKKKKELHQKIQKGRIQEIASMKIG